MNVVDLDVVNVGTCKMNRDAAADQRIAAFSRQRFIQSEPLPFPDEMSFQITRWQQLELGFRCLY